MAKLILSTVNLTKNLATEFVVQLRTPTGRGVLRELAPPMPQELPQAFREGVKLFKSRGNWKNVTVREAWRNALITTEVICWFFVGEIIGKGTLIGYQV